MTADERAGDGRVGRDSGTRDRSDDRDAGEGDRPETAASPPPDDGGDRIGRLGPAARERIAAGEVVTRPARVVAELLDNALDAGADRIEVAVEGDGTDRIRVRDDGRGMSRPDAELAVERHATSKVAGAGDLDRVGTLGFRGEALPSIAAVARLELVTNDGDGGEATRVVVDRDGERRVESAARGRGTTVTVTDLFHNRAPRRAALGTTRTEFGRISDLVADYALCRPAVAVRLVHDGTETLATPGTGPTDAALGVYDRAVAGESTTLDAEATAGGDPVAVTGLLAYPAVTRATPDHVRIAVNGRPVRDDDLRRAVRRGYGSLLPGDRHPIAALSVSLPPAAVDPNVDPHKRRVGLRNADEVADSVESAVGDALATADLRRTAAVATDLDAALAPASASPFDGARVIGQYRDLYVLCEADGDLLVVDAHAAHERVNYERLRAALDDEGVPSAPVDPPATVALSPGGVAVVEERAADLERLGFAVEPFGGDTAKVSAVPAPLGRRAAPETLRDAVDALRAGEAADRRDALLKDLACHPSLSAGADLGDDEARSLLDALGACERPYACPHGRPTVLSVDEATLAKGFEREGVRFD